MSQNPLLSSLDSWSRSQFEDTEAGAFNSRGNDYASNTEAAPFDNTPRMDCFSPQLVRHRLASTYDERTGLAPLIHYLEGFASPATPSMNINGVSISNPFLPLPHAEPEFISGPIQHSNNALFNPTADNSTPKDLRYTQFSAHLRQTMSQSDIDPHTLISRPCSRRVTLMPLAFEGFWRPDLAATAPQTRKCVDASNAGAARQRNGEGIPRQRFCCAILAVRRRTERECSDHL
ncbi:hypothetical protein R3P38DRAFT_3223945 [Favolaschia claudopus]|uniref:Uncharacterized protein n=1 Tax=Favolaschia claudopus TaxID=2862362 RepID=A0AAV9ZW88_9AGAR